MSETVALQNPDVLVVGGGSAGLSAAIAARHAGASVRLVEEAPLRNAEAHLIGRPRLDERLVRTALQQQCLDSIDAIGTVAIGALQKIPAPQAFVEPSHRFVDPPHAQASRMLATPMLSSTAPA